MDAGSRHLLVASVFLLLLGCHRTTLNRDKCPPSSPKTRTSSQCSPRPERAGQWADLAVMSGGDVQVLSELKRLFDPKGIEFSTDGSIWWGVSVRRVDYERALLLIRSSPNLVHTEFPMLEFKASK